MSIVTIPATVDKIPLRKGITKFIHHETKTYYLDPNHNNIQFLYALNEKGYKQPSIDQRLRSLFQNLSSYEKHDQNELSEILKKDKPISIDLDCALDGYITNFGQIYLPEEIQYLVTKDKRSIQRIWLERTPYAYWVAKIQLEKTEIQISPAFLTKQYLRQIKSLWKKYLRSLKNSKNSERLKKRLIRVLGKAQEEVDIDKFSDIIIHFFGKQVEEFLETTPKT